MKTGKCSWREFVQINNELNDQTGNNIWSICLFLPFSSQWQPQLLLYSELFLPRHEKRMCYVTFHWKWARMPGYFKMREFSKAVENFHFKESKLYQWSLNYDIFWTFHNCEKDLLLCRRDEKSSPILNVLCCIVSCSCLESVPKLVFDPLQWFTNKSSSSHLILQTCCEFVFQKLFCVHLS